MGSGLKSSQDKKSNVLISWKQSFGIKISSLKQRQLILEIIPVEEEKVCGRPVSQTGRCICLPNVTYYYDFGTS